VRAYIRPHKGRLVYVHDDRRELARDRNADITPMVLDLHVTEHDRKARSAWMTMLDRSGGPGFFSENAYSIVKGCDDISSIVEGSFDGYNMC
jgi:hypothetical protein